VELSRGPGGALLAQPLCPAPQLPVQPFPISLPSNAFPLTAAAGRLSGERGAGGSSVPAVGTRPDAGQERGTFPGASTTARKTPKLGVITKMLKVLWIGKPKSAPLKRGVIRRALR